MSDLTPGQFGFLFAFVGTLLIWAGGRYERKRAATAECHEKGHLWTEMFSGLECSRCGSRPRD